MTFGTLGLAPFFHLHDVKRASLLFLLCVHGCECVRRWIYFDLLVKRREQNKKKKRRNIYVRTKWKCKKSLTCKFLNWCVLHKRIMSLFNRNQNVIVGLFGFGLHSVDVSSIAANIKGIYYDSIQQKLYLIWFSIINLKFDINRTLRDFC